MSEKESEKLLKGTVAVSEQTVVKQQIEAVVDEMKANKDYQTDFYNARKLMRLLRFGKIRRSDLVMNYGVQLLLRQSKLGDELFPVVEQIFYASLDVDNKEKAEECIKILKAHFPSSLKIKCFEGIVKESEKKFDDALKLYEEVLKEDDCFALALRRQVCVYKGKKDFGKAINVMNNEYLKLYQADVEAWQELADLYLHQGMLKDAAFCFEELLLTTPYHPHYIMSYASICYSIGSYDHLILARKYFCFAHELNVSDLRALLGIAQSTIQLSSQLKLTSSKKLEEENSKLHAYATKKLASKKLIVPSLPIKQ